MDQELSIQEFGQANGGVKDGGLHPYLNDSFAFFCWAMA